MLNWIIDFSLRNRLIVLCGVVLVIAVGAFSLRYLNIDAFPDTTPVMVQINVSAPGWSPEEMERQVSYPLEQALAKIRSATSAENDFSE